ncbi:hypothetical protein ES703_18429 [subsurface metagenome]
MERKEVIVAGKTFDLGLKGLDDEITDGRQSNRTIELPVGLQVFQVGYSRQDTAIILHWTGMTNIRNIIWMRFVMFRLRWPPMQSLSCFTFTRED